MDYVIPLIGEAWDHRRRRHRRWSLAAAIVILSGAVVGLASVVIPAGPRVVAGMLIPKTTVEMPSAAAFSQPPYMGVSCSVPNSVACDRVGLAIWLRRPAYSVDASIAGAPFRLDWFGDEYRFGRQSPPRRAFTGYLQPAGIVGRLHVRPLTGAMWYGSGNPLPMVWVLINYGRGRYVLTQLRVPLNTGWG